MVRRESGQMCRIWPWRGGDDALEAFRSDGLDILHGRPFRICILAILPTLGVS